MAPAPPVETADAGIDAAGFAIVPLRLHATSDAGPSLEVVLQPDGALLVNGRNIARVEPRRVVALDGTPLLSVEDNGMVAAAGSEGPSRARILPDGTLHGQNPDGSETTLSISADGTPVMRHSDGRVDPAPVQFDNVPREARGTATLVTLLLLVAPAAGAAEAPPAAEGMDAGAPAAPTTPPATRPRRRGR
jgi:hypothetical protein